MFSTRKISLIKKIICGFLLQNEFLFLFFTNGIKQKIDIEVRLTGVAEGSESYLVTGNYMRNFFEPPNGSYELKRLDLIVKC